MNLIEKFIEKKLNSYIEPIRAGTPHGEIVGLSKKKYHATLLCALTDFSQKNIAGKLGVSYSLLLKWRTETEFKKQMNLHKIQFLMSIIDINSSMSLSQLLRKYVFDNFSKDDLIRVLYEKL